MMKRASVHGRLAVAVLLPAVVLLASCGWYRPEAHIRSIGHTVSGNRDGRTEATFEVINGADVVRVRAADLDDDLYRMSTSDDAKVRPSVQVDGDTVLAGLAGTGRGGPAIVDIVLSDAVMWHIRLAGGATEEVIDLTAGRPGVVEFSAGTNRAEVSLPVAKATVRVVMSGGASQFLVHLAGDAPVRVRAAGGAGTVTVDGVSRSGVAGGTTITPDGWTAADNRYDIDATAGVSTLTVDRR
jgi:hypothetical protein